MINKLQNNIETCKRLLEFKETETIGCRNNGCYIHGHQNIGTNSTCNCFKTEIGLSNFRYLNYKINVMHSIIKKLVEEIDDKELICVYENIIRKI